LAKSKIASSKGEDKQHDHPWAPGLWTQALRDLAAGTSKRQPEPRFPVILTPDGPVSSPAELQHLAELESLPQTMETSQVSWDVVEPKRVTICHVSREERKRIEEKAETLLDKEESILVMFQGEKRSAILVTALKKGAELSRGGCRT
jgi:hypothetical protein